MRRFFKRSCREKLIILKRDYNVQWGVGPGCNTREIADKLIDLKTELDDLALREHELDQQKVWVQQSIKNVTDDSDLVLVPAVETHSARDGNGFSLDRL
ncbi:Transcription factor e2f4 [Ilyodon furcidens]|uniref:Transcription factor e2f4 n=1 Tax=Ilyodon furcidens TaxID=33524 RepID=A0ABV0VIT9_9TELE